MMLMLLRCRQRWLWCAICMPATAESRSDLPLPCLWLMTVAHVYHVIQFSTLLTHGAKA